MLILLDLIKNTAQLRDPERPLKSWPICPYQLQQNSPSCVWAFLNHSSSVGWQQPRGETEQLHFGAGFFRGVGGWTVHVVSRRTSALSLVERWTWSGSGSLKKHVLYNLCGSEARLHLWNVFLRNGSEVKPSHNSHSRWTKTTVIH